MSSVLQVVVLAVVQGLTEFLPVSSSGHLALAQILFGDALDIGDAVAMDVALHLGTLVPVLWFYRSDLLQLGRHGMGRGGADEIGLARRYLLLLVLASVPTAAIGLLFQEDFEALFTVPVAVGAALWITALLLVFSRLFERPARSAGLTVGVLSALVMGIVQGLAITPGISRSGATISVALMLGVSRSEAARFSFLLSVPAIGGAALLKLGEAAGDLRWNLVLLGFVISALVGYAALTLLVQLVERGRLWSFAPYVVVVGALAIALG
jgi:undecaprenyl-diphosphatase